MPYVVFHVGFDKANQRPGFVAQFAENRIDHFDVRAVPVYEDDPVEAMMDQAARHVVDEVEQGGTANA